MSTLAALTGRWSLRNAIRRRILEHARRRREPQNPPFTLRYRHIYVLPTAFGGGFAVMLVFMALGGLNFNNNMALMLVFVVGTVVQMTTLLAYRNLVDLSIDGIQAEPAFAGETAHFEVRVSNPEDRERSTIQAAAVGDPAGDCTDIPATGNCLLTINIQTDARGWLDMPPFRLETRFPLGMFRSWSWVFPHARCLVYPTPAGDPPPLPMAGTGQSGESRRGEGDQVHGLRDYRDGDPLRRVAWRTSARHNQLYTREMEVPREEACEMSWDQLEGRAVEDRLSVLTAWVLQADHRQLAFSLELPGSGILGPASGADHRARCLEALALFGS